MTIEIDRTFVGQEFDHTVFPPVTVEQILEYGAAYGERHPLYTDADAAARGPYGGLVAPPTFALCVRGKHFMPEYLPPDLMRREVFDAGKDIETGAPVRPGDVLTARSIVHDVYEKTGRSGRMSFVVFRTVVTNQRDETVAVIDQKMMFR